MRLYIIKTPNDVDIHDALTSIPNIEIKEVKGCDTCEYCDIDKEYCELKWHPVNIDFIFVNECTWYKSKNIQK